KRYLNFIGESFCDVEIAGAGRRDHLLVSGNSTNSSQAKVPVTAMDPQTRYRPGPSYRMLTSDGVIYGEFAGAFYKSAFLDVALKQCTNAVDLTIAQQESGGETPGGENPGGENPGG
ncbi:autotransporter outer membrane beta-barrel domain-containing protein, partial [Enterobacter cloacae complex sp. 4DZ3-17B2]